MDGGPAPRLDEDGFPIKEANPSVYDIYNREAKGYDSAMVESWKTAMQGLLIFAGLFSATVTSFIIEGYRSLQPDSGDLTVVLLSQISQQVAFIANGTQVPSPLITSPFTIPFSPSWTAVTANILWFISLGLSLACAVAATFVQQWARNYIHAIERRPTAYRRARMRMYLYQGVERFRMSKMVDSIPALLHLALFSFLLGLVFFIQPISWPLSATALAIFLSSLAAYLFATFLPFFAFDSPIQTPLTSVVWYQPVISALYRVCLWTSIIFFTVKYPTFGLGQRLYSCFRPIKYVFAAVDLVYRRARTYLIHHLSICIVRKRPPLEDRWLQLKERWTCDGFGSLNAVRSSAARETSTPASQEREQKAFAWLVECLDEDREILPFIEAMPTFLKQAPLELGHDPRSTLSHVFRHPRLSLFTRLPVLLRRHHDNTRVQIAFAEFIQCVDREDWIHIFRSGLTTPRHLWPDDLPLQLSFANIMESCPKETRLQMNAIQSTIDFSWLSAGQSWIPVSKVGAMQPNNWWPDPLKTLWKDLLEQFDVHYFVYDIPTYLRPTVSFTKAFLNVLADMNPEHEGQARLILRDYLHTSTTWFTESLTPEHQRLYFAILMTIISAIEIKYETSIPFPILDVLDSLLLKLQDISDRDVVKDLDCLLQRKMWFESLNLIPRFRAIVEAHMAKRDDSGRLILSPQVIATYKLVMLGQPTRDDKAIMLVESLNLRETNPAVQRFFVDLCSWLYRSHTFGSGRSGIDAETGIDEVVLFVESVIQVLYTVDDLQALRDALRFLKVFLRIDHYPYHEHALECRGYLEKLIY